MPRQAARQPTRKRRGYNAVEIPWLNQSSAHASSNDPCAFLALTAGFLGAAHADGFDPFGTAENAPPRPTLSADHPAATPCLPSAQDATLNVVEAVNQALCRNPQTREAWANARFQAAQVGVAQAAYLPNLDGKLSENRISGDSTSARQKTASLTLSWLLADFGARSANLENARQLLAAASFTQDAAVQNVFLAALQAYYNAQAARTALAAATEAEKASHESLSAASLRYRIGVATPADRLQAQTAWSQATLYRVRAEGGFTQCIRPLANTMGLDANAPLNLAELPEDLPDASFSHDIQALIETARARRPDLLAAEAGFKAAQAAIDAARAAGSQTFP